MPFVPPTLRLRRDQYDVIVAHCYDGLPLEACGLLGGPVTNAGEPTGDITSIYPCVNVDASARVYSIDSRDYMRSMRDAETQGGELVGVWHSHTHTDAYPSETDVRQAFEPHWFYVLVSLKHPEPVLRAYRIRGGQTHEVDVDVPGLT